MCNTINNKILIRVANTTSDVIQLAYLRGVIFGAEQGISYKDEFSSDQGSIYIIAKDEDEPVGLIRFRCFKDFVKLERMGVREAYRKTALAKQLFEKALSVCGMMGYDKAHGVCEEPLLKYWAQYGFHKLEGAAPVYLDNKTFYAISGPISVPDNHIRITDDPNRINAPIGDWDSKRKALGLDRALDSNFVIRIKHARLYESKY